MNNDCIETHNILINAGFDTNHYNYLIACFPDKAEIYLKEAKRINVENNNRIRK